MFTKECKFELSDDQYNKIVEWDKTHKCTLRPNYGIKKYCGPIGGAISITFIPTSIGMIVKVKCACGDSFNVSENL